MTCRSVLRLLHVPYLTHVLRPQGKHHFEAKVAGDSPTPVVDIREIAQDFFVIFKLVQHYFARELSVTRDVINLYCAAIEAPLL